jgi:peptidoglycan hydrolase-like protein with peptidoglycan-binding domain
MKMLRKILILVSAFLLLAAGAFAQGDSTSKTTTATTASTAKPAAFRPTKDQIKLGQEVLIKEKLYTGQATGVYGESRPAIKAYQKAHGLDVNGKFDRATLEKMGIALTEKQTGMASASATGAAPSTSSKAGTTTKQIAAGSQNSAGPKRPAPFQANADQIKQLQQKLIDAKMFTGAADGKRSDALKASVAKYQEANGLKATGGINAATLEKMGIALTDAQKANVAAQAAYDAAKPATKQD